ncbi:hypothetical protein [Cystobacter fuscus]|uniref:hypothetical protein n=1 Tax=Cystobacter fuscus TaxID=43 RepID=UPI002B3069F6|nr:hypothetical protein F0U63_27400 [Cystobacter fuscus]
MASRTQDIGDKGFLRIEYVVECKWTRDKPWVVFASKRGIHPAAAIAQTMGSSLGEACLWFAADNAEMQNLDLFKKLPRSGFSGVRAFGAGEDLFYNALRGVAERAWCRVAYYDSPPTPPDVLPETTVIVRPVIVIDGDLLEAYYDDSTQKLELVRASKARIHWRGAEKWSLHCLVDVVTVDGLEEYVQTQAKQVKTVFSVLGRAREDIEKCFIEKSLDVLRPTKGPRGVLNLPPLLALFQEHLEGSHRTLPKHPPKKKRQTRRK